MSIIQAMECRKLWQFNVVPFREARLTSRASPSLDAVYLEGKSWFPTSASFDIPSLAGRTVDDATGVFHTQDAMHVSSLMGIFETA